jgi:ketosteroid isomerase-like protein
MAQQAGTSAGGGKAGEVGLSAREDARVQAFLDGFAQALTAGDARAIAAMWQTPALVLGDRELRALASPAEIEAFFGGARDRYNARGIDEARPEIVSVDWLTERIATVRVRWPYLGSGGSEVGEESSTYTLRQDDTGQLKLCVAVMHGAVTRH